MVELHFLMNLIRLKIFKYPYQLRFLSLNCNNLHYYNKINLFKVEIKFLVKVKLLPRRIHIVIIQLCKEVPFSLISLILPQTNLSSQYYFKMIKIMMQDWFQVFLEIRLILKRLKNL